MRGERDVAGTRTYKEIFTKTEVRMEKDENISAEYNFLTVNRVCQLHFVYLLVYPHELWNRTGPEFRPGLGTQ